MVKLRLLLLAECNRACKGCCNKNWDLSALPVCTSFSGYEQVILTGGEPLLEPDLVREAVAEIRRQTRAPIYLYTAWRNDPWLLHNILTLVDGVTLTLHTRKDVEPFKAFNKILRVMGCSGKSLRLNVFHGVSLGDEDVSAWEVKRDIRWIKDCPLPTDEVFMRFAK